MWVWVLLMAGVSAPLWGQEAPSPSAPAAQTAAPDGLGAPVFRRSPRRARPNPDAEGRYHIGDGVRPPVLLSTVEPEYTEKARKAKLSGDCQVRVTVDKDGVPQNATVARSLAESVPPNQRDAALSLDAKAIEAVEGYRFRPAMFGDKSVPIEMTVSVNFQIF